MLRRLKKDVDRSDVILQTAMFISITSSLAYVQVDSTSKGQ